MSFLHATHLLPVLGLYESWTKWGRLTQAFLFLKIPAKTQRVNPMFPNRQKTRFFSAIEKLIIYKCLSLQYLLNKGRKLKSYKKFCFLNESENNIGIGNWEIILWRPHSDGFYLQKIPPNWIFKINLLISIQRSCYGWEMSMPYYCSDGSEIGNFWSRNFVIDFFLFFASILVCAFWTFVELKLVPIFIPTVLTIYSSL